MKEYGYARGSFEVSKDSILLAVWALARSEDIQLVDKHNNYRGEEVI